MDWDKLKSFHFAAETGSLTAAADRVGLSQSAVSRQIQALELDLGVPLFQRHARGLALTEGGKALHQQTSDMALAAALAENALKDARDRPFGELRVTAPVAFGSTWLVPRLQDFFKLAPDVRLNISLDDREYDLLKLEAECAIRLWSANQADLIQRRIMKVGIGMYASKAYLEAHGTPGDTNALDDHHMVAYAHQVSTPLDDLNWPLRSGREDTPPREPRLMVNSVPAMVKAVEAGVGIGGLPDYMVAPNANLVRILPELPGPSYEVFFIYPSDLRRSKRISAFRQFLIEAADASGTGIK